MRKNEFQEQGDGMRLLLIENDLSNGKVLRDVFALWGHDVHLCLSGSDLSDKLHGTDWHGVVTELAIPGMEKYQAISEVKKEMPWVPVIVLTESGTVKSAVKAIQNGADEFFIKPADIDQLKAILQQINANICRWERPDYLQRRLQDTSFEMQIQIEKLLHFMKKSKQDYQKSKSLQQSSLDSITEGILMVDDQGAVQLINTKMSQFLGIPDAAAVYEKSLFLEFPHLKSTELFRLFESAVYQKKSMTVDQFQFKTESKSSRKPVKISVAAINFSLKTGVFNGAIFIMKKGQGS